MTRSLSPKTIGIYSVGLLGGSLGLALKTFGYSGKIMGFSSPGGLDVAKSIGCIDEGYAYDQLAQNIQDIDLLILCSPIMAIKQCLTNLGKMSLPKGLVITDAGSTKREIQEVAKKVLPAHVTFVGGHPMAGSEKSGPAASDPYLFQNAVYAIATKSKEPSTLEVSLAAFFRQYLGCRTIFLDATTHDRIAATVSHVPHLIAVALMNAVGKIENNQPGTLHLAAGGLRDMTRIASSPYSMWHDILITNKECIESMLDECFAQLSTIKEELSQDSLADSFAAAAKTRELVPSGGKGFITPLHEIVVVVWDKPGVIAKIASTLADRDINIKDIEVLKIREGEGGTMRLAFENAEKAKTAIDVLNSSGFTARERT